MIFKTRKKYLFDFRKLKLLFFINIIFFSFSYLLQLHNVKVCLCTIGKLENLYVREYIEHYKNYGVNKIFIYDNNEIIGERFESVINDYIINGFVELINFRGKIKAQKEAVQDCLNNNYNKYDWLIFYDMDEFIYLKDFKTIQSYLNRKLFQTCQVVHLNLLFASDNNLIYYDNRPLRVRFPKSSYYSSVGTLKSILKGNIKIDITNIHIINKKLKSCNGFGHYNNKEKYKIFTNNADYKFYYINHYCFKSTEEFIYKLNRGSAYSGFSIKAKMKKISWYFGRNKITSEKIDLIEKYTKLNLSEYRDKIRKYKL